ncbi:helix-turn-helix domain-containing protein [Kordiimonas sp.]|uniref:helix-turn-helix domain-containing protein n=1 Tax=Kordiimonas sp. TaxID=1970157 RepID=UPI003A8CD5BB
MAQPAKHHTVKSLAEELGCSTVHIYNQVREGKLPHIKIGSSIRFPKQLIEEYLNEQWQSSLNTTMEGGISTMLTRTTDGAESFQRALETRA